MKGLEKNNRFRGHATFPTPEGVKSLHFGMNFIKNLEDLTEMPLDKWSAAQEELTETGQLMSFCDIVFAGMWASDQLNDGEFDYSINHVREWVYDVIKLEKDLEKEDQTIFKLTKLMAEQLKPSTAVGKQKGKK